MKRYLSCRYIERGIVFSPGRVITPCCVNPATGLVPELVPFNGSDFSIDGMLEARAEMIRRHKSGDIVKGCQGCPRLTEREWNIKETGPYAIDEVTVAPFFQLQYPLQLLLYGDQSGADLAALEGATRSSGV